MRLDVPGLTSIKYPIIGNAATLAVIGQPFFKTVELKYTFMQPKRTINYWTNFSPSYYSIQLLTVFLFIVSSVNAQQVQCSLQKNSDSVYGGLCQCKDSLVFSLNLKQTQGDKTGIWKGKSSANATSANDPIFLEITPKGGTLATVYRSGAGIPYGWYDISNLEINNSQLKFTFNLQEICKPKTRDVTILKKARSYLSDSTKWNRFDNRTFGYIDCQPKSKKKTLFCALYAAQSHVLGDFYGGPSFWALIGEIQLLGQYRHPIQAFNNDLKTSFKMLQKVFDDAISRASQTVDSKQ